MLINEHILSLSGKASTQEPLELGEDYKITIEGTITTQTDVDNDNGTKNRINKLKPRLVEDIVHKGRIIRVKDKSSNSQKTKQRHYVWEVEHPDVEIDYELFGSLLRLHFDEVMDYLIQKQYGRNNS